MTKPAESNPPSQPRMGGIPRESADTTTLPRQDEGVGPSQYVMITTPDGWQLLLEYADHYLRWVMRGTPGTGGQAWPDIDVARSSLEGEGGSLQKKPALAREGNEVGTFHNVRTRNGETVPMNECLDEGVLELEFDGAKLAGRWRLSRSGMSRREQETWTLRRVAD